MKDDPGAAYPRDYFEFKTVTEKGLERCDPDYTAQRPPIGGPENVRNLSGNGKHQDVSVALRREQLSRGVRTGKFRWWLAVGSTAAR